MNYRNGGLITGHRHSWTQFLYAQKGAIKARIGARTLVVGPRNGVLIPPGTEHQLTMSCELELRTLYFQQKRRTQIIDSSVIEVSRLLHEAILRVCKQIFLDSRSKFDRSLSHVIVDELCNAPRTEIELSVPNDDRAQSLCDLFLDKKSASKPLITLCNEAGLSRRTAERLFSKETGLTPAQWRQHAVLSESLINLVGGMSIDDASHAAGYKNRSSFSEAFKRTFGYAPGSVVRMR